MQDQTQTSQGYPKGFWNLFSSEIISRYGFWSIQSLLVLFLVSNSFFTEEKAYSFFGAYCALTYAATILGGYISDKYIGYQRAVAVGAILSLFGSLLLATSTFTINPGLSLMVLGTGLLIPNITTYIGATLNKTSMNRDHGFSTFYVATNIGGISGPLISSFLYKYYGWNAACYAVTLTMVLLLVLYLHSASNEKSTSENLTHRGIVKSTVILLLGFFISFFMLDHSNLLGALLSIVFLGTLFDCFKKVMAENQHKKMEILFIFLGILISLYFFVFELQILTSLILFDSKTINNSILGFDIPPSATVSAEPLFVVLLIPVINLFNKKKLSKKQNFFAPYFKLCLGVGILALCFLTFALIAKYSEIHHVKVSLVWLMLGVAMMAMGEIFIMPPLLSAITRDVSKNIKSTVIGLLYLAISLSGYLAGQVAKLTDSSSHISLYGINGYYQTYLLIAAVSIVLAAIFIGLLRSQKRKILSPTEMAIS